MPHWSCAQAGTAWSKLPGLGRDLHSEERQALSADFLMRDRRSGIRGAHAQLLRTPGTCTHEAAGLLQQGLA